MSKREVTTCDICKQEVDTDRFDSDWLEIRVMRGGTLRGTLHTHVHCIFMAGGAKVDVDIAELGDSDYHGL